MGNATAMQVGQKAKSIKGGWAVLVVVWLSGFAMPANMAKVTTLAPAIMGQFGIGPGGIGWVIALFYALGFIFAFPAAAMVNKLGIRKVVFIALGCAILGGVIGLFSPNLAVFMVSRFLEGAGMGLMGVVGIAAISPWFPASRRGLPLGIWAMWVAVAMFLCPIVYARIFEATGAWQSVWWTALVVDIIVLILFAIFYHEPKYMFNENEEVVEINEETLAEMPRPNFKDALKTPIVWALGLVFFFEEAAFLSVQGFFTTYANSNLDCTLTVAALIVGSAALLGAVFCPIAGKISDKLGTRKWVLVVGIVAGIVYSWFMFSITNVSAYWPVVICAGITGGGVPAILWTCSAEVVPPHAVAGATAVLAFMQNVGMFIGAAGLGVAIEAIGDWTIAARTVITPLFALALIVALVGLRKLK